MWRLLGAITPLYVAFGLIYGLMQGGLPPLMRARGVDLAAIGWTFVMLVPFGLTFLWAPVIDAVRPLRDRRLIGWIVLMQAVIVAMLLAVSKSEHAAPSLLLLMGLPTAFAAATTDVALDALATASVPARYRTTASGLKVAALAIGAMLGGGVFVATAGTLGWAATFQARATFSALTIIPIALVRMPIGATKAVMSKRPDVLAMMQDRTMRSRIGVLALATCSMVAPSFFNRVLLVDLGVPVTVIGRIVGLGTPLCGLLASLAAIPLLGRVGARTGVAMFAGLCIAAVAVLAISAWLRMPTIAMVAAMVMNADTSGFFVIMCTATLGWPQGNQPATDYAALYGISRLAATMLMIASGGLIARIGWPGFYALAAVASGASMLVLRGALPSGRVAASDDPRTINLATGAEA